MIQNMTLQAGKYRKIENYFKDHLATWELLVWTRKWFLHWFNGVGGYDFVESNRLRPNKTILQQYHIFLQDGRFHVFFSFLLFSFIQRIEQIYFTW